MTLLLSILIGVLSCGFLILFGERSFLSVKYTCYYLPFYLLGYIESEIRFNKDILKKYSDICSITGCIIIIHMVSELMNLKKS